MTFLSDNNKMTSTDDQLDLEGFQNDPSLSIIDESNRGGGGGIDESSTNSTSGGGHSTSGGSDISGSTSKGGNNNTGNKSGDDIVPVKDERLVWRARSVFLMVLVLAAAALCAVVYLVTSQDEVDDFEAQVRWNLII